MKMKAEIRVAFPTGQGKAKIASKSPEAGERHETVSFTLSEDTLSTT